MRKNLISVEDATEELRALGYLLRTRKQQNCIVGHVRSLKSGGHAESQALEGLTRPAPEIVATHPSLIAWVNANAIIDGSHHVII